MEARPGRYVDVEVRVVDPVEAPQRRHGVERHVLEVDREVQEDDRERDRDPARNRERVDEPPTAYLARDRHSDRRPWRDEPQDRDVDREETQVVGPARAAAEGGAPPRRGELPKRDREEHAEECAEADQRLGYDARAHRVARRPVWLLDSPLNYSCIQENA